MNDLGKSGTPFLFMIDFEQEQPIVIPLKDIDPEELQYDFPHHRNQASLPSPTIEHIVFEAVPIPFTRYSEAYELVQHDLRRGDSFLLNLTFPNRLITEFSLSQMFHLADAPYKLWWKGHFTCFSPETFVRIRDGRIYAYPMKGTLDANEGHGPQALLQDPKERAEHATIVDLIRNDLSQVAQKVRVSRYRYPEQIHTSRGSIWQTSSEINGVLPAEYHTRIGDLIFRLLPAGSISGAPKSRTVEIIQAAEGQKRGYYTGVAGIFDGRNLDSAVLIRYVEKRQDVLYFHSGGGITTFSRVRDEYRELIRKVDLPVRKEWRTIQNRELGVGSFRF